MSETADSDDKTVTATCPDEKIAIGGGARIVAASGSMSAAVPAGVVIVGSYPAGLDGEKPSGWTAMAGEVGSVSDNWHLSVHAVCAQLAD